MGKTKKPHKSKVQAKKKKRVAKNRHVSDLAKDLVYSERAKQYGSFKDNAQRVLDIYKAISGSTIVDCPTSVAIFMLSLKLAREGTKHKRDNLIDSIGYIELWDQLLGGE